MVTYAFGFQLISLFLFVFTADHLHTLFVGAMCAAGSLNVNEYGYPTVILKMVNFLLCGVWLILNFIDNRAYDYPLIKKKYMALWMITPGILIEMVLQANYFLNMKPNIITSCCGILFSANADAVTSVIVALPLFPVSPLFYTTMGLSVGLGIFFYIRGQGAYLYSLANTVAFIVSIVALISYISLYIYELPTHHCPFDILQKEYNFVGYPLYMTLLGGTVAGIGVGADAFQKNQKPYGDRSDHPETAHLDFTDFLLAIHAHRSPQCDLFKPHTGVYLILSCNQDDLNICFCLYPPILATSKGGQAEQWDHAA